MIYERVETSSGNDLECSSHYSNGEGGPPDPYQDSFSTMGGPPDPHENNSLSIEPCFDENLHSTKIELNLEAFENRAITQGHNLKDDSSCSSSELCIFESNDLSFYERIDGILEDASKDLDRSMDEIFHNHATPTSERVAPTPECATSTFDLVAPNSECATLTSIVQCDNEADADQSFERSIVSSDVVGRSLGHHHQAYDYSPDPPNRNDKFLPQDASFASEGITSYLSSLHEIEFEFDSSPFFPMETVLPQEEVRILKSPSSSSLETSSRKNLSLQNILKFIRIAPSFKDHKSILSLIVRASSFKNPIPHSSCEDIMKLKTFLLQNMHSSSILREALHKWKEIEPRILPSHHSSKDFEKPVDIEHETSPTKGNPPNFITPIKVKKVSFKEDNASRIITPSLRIITPASSQPASTYRKKKKNQLAILTSILIASSLALNVESHLVLRPKRRTSKAPPTREVFPPLKKSPSSSLKMRPSSSS